ncbi:MAG: DsrE family protein [Gammaproteobacteria bacterium]|nr:DsrE family protein [Gammaproteobacteria bacterium]
MKKVLLIVTAILVLGVVNTASADEGCVVGLVNNLSLNDEFGPGAAEKTHCLDNQKSVKLMMQVNAYCMDNVPNSECTRPYGLQQLFSMIKDYEITHGMQVGRDYELAVIAHTAGAPLMLSNTTHNPFAGKVTQLIDKGVKFYMCQNAARSLISKGLLTQGNVTNEIVAGVEFVTAGLTAVSDFQSQGYTYVQP